MHSISRIYVGNYGWNSAWYDGVVFDLRDCETGEPTDAILTLENGGGKTTLLSFILSCFDARQDRFLKRLHDANNRFPQYFSADGLPGVILVEWIYKDHAGRKSTFVTGQCVAVKSSIDPNEVERYFFSFECRDDLQFESVPAPKLNADFVRSMPEFMTWMNRTRLSHKGNFFETRNINDWERHLETERGLDVHMLKLQVDFSRQEGGIDSAFLTFRTEQEFLRKFFTLTMDAKRANEVRKGVAAACDKLQRKPLFEQRLVAMSGLQGHMVAFADEAKNLRVAKLQFEELKQSIRRAYFTLSKHAEETLAQAQANGARSSALHERAESCKNAASMFAARWAGTWAVLLHRQFEQATIQRDTQAQSVAKIERLLKQIDAARALEEIEGLTAEISRLEQLGEQQRKGLEPFEREAKFQGTLLRTGLTQMEVTTRCRANETKNNSVFEQESGRSKQQLVESKNGDMARNHASLSTLRHQQNNYEKDLHRLIERGCLQAPGENIELAISRYDATAVEHLKKQTDAREEAKFVSESIRKTQDEHSKLGQQIVHEQHTLNEYRQWIGKGDADCEKLSHDKTLCLALESEVVDPHSPETIRYLDRFIESTQQSIDTQAVKIAELDKDAVSIARTGLAGYSPDLDAVIALLIARGVKSARSHNVYIAEIEPNEQRAREIVNSNPSRYLGVAVQSESDLARAREILLGNPPNLTRPVPVSLAKDNVDDLIDGFVVPPRDGSLYNFAHARALTESLNSRKQHESLEKAGCEQLQREGLEAKGFLSAYLATYGDGKLQDKRLQTARIDSEIERLTATVEDLQQQLAMLRNRESYCRDEESRSIQIVHESQSRSQALSEFIQRYGDTSKRLGEIDSLSAELKQLESAKNALRLQINEHQEREKRLLLEEQELARNADDLKREIQDVRHIDLFMDAEQHLRLNPTHVNRLREMYAQAKDLLDREQRDKLGPIKEKIDLNHNQIKKKSEEYRKRYAAFPREEIAGFIGCDYDFRIASTESELSVARARLEEVSRQEAILQKESSEFCAAHPGRLDLSGELVDTALAELFAQCDELKSQELSTTDEYQSTSRESIEARELSQVYRRKHETTNHLAEALADLASGFLPCEPDATLLEPEEALPEKIRKVLQEHRTVEKQLHQCNSKANKLYQAVREASATIIEHEAEIAHELVKNDLDAASENAERLLSAVEVRVGALRDILSALKADFDVAVDELYGLVHEGITLLNAAVKKRVPEQVPYVGGKPVIRISAALSAIPVEARKQSISNLMDEVIRSGLPHKLGTDLVADAVLRLNGKPLGIKFLKMTLEPSEQYSPVEKLSNSGGEAVVMAMFLYIVLAQLRAETQADHRRAGGGPLILDNPFAKATTPTLWVGQRALAKAMGVQLIFATAMSDYNTLGEFERIFRLRAKSSQNSKTGRYHIELVDYQLIKNA